MAEIDIDQLLKQAEALVKSKKKKKPVKRKKRRKAVVRSSAGYQYVYKGDKLVPKHRVIMEEHIGRPLMKHEAVYFKDGDKNNLAIENLQLGIKPGKHEIVYCPYCSKNILETTSDAQ